MKRVVSTTTAPAAVGPYSQAIICGNLLFASGQLPLDPNNGQLIIGDLATQTRRVLANIGAILRTQNLDYSDIIKVTVYLTDLSQFEEFNKAYAGYFPIDPPARSCVQVAALPKGAFVEIDVIAAISSNTNPI